MNKTNKNKKKKKKRLMPFLCNSVTAIWAKYNGVVALANINGPVAVGARVYNLLAFAPILMINQYRSSETHRLYRRRS